MNEVRIGIIGCGGMGRQHAGYLSKGQVEGATLAAMCDINEKALEDARVLFGDKVTYFSDPQHLLESGCVDSVLVATAHYKHPELCMGALKKGLHVLVEKPAGVFTQNVRQLNKLANQSDRVFGIMFNQRTRPVYQKLRDLIDSGELGKIKRTNWIITDWYRAQSYYDSGTWRATWEGEGGGVLLNQCPHQLDLWQWICGLPVRVRAFCSFGKYHDIEVEDDVTAYVEYDTGATGVFITSTGEAPGSNRLELAGDRGKIVVENQKITFWRNRVPERQFNREYKGDFGQPECWKCEVPVGEPGIEHKLITQDWVNAIRKGSALLAPGTEGIRSLELGNAMLLSTWIDDWVDLPFDESFFKEQLESRIASSTHKKKTVAPRVMDVAGSF